jgi:Alpha/beta hydrolase domain containing 18
MTFIFSKITLRASFFSSLIINKSKTKACFAFLFVLFRLFEFRKVMSNRETCSKLVDKDYPVEIISETENSDCRIIEGKFLSPLEQHLPGLVPEAAKNAHFQIILPKVWKDEDYKPVCLHLAGTGDHVS